MSNHIGIIETFTAQSGVWFDLPAGTIIVTTGLEDCGPEIKYKLLKNISFQMNDDTQVEKVDR